MQNPNVKIVFGYPTLLSWRIYKNTTVFVALVSFCSKLENQTSEFITCVNKNIIGPWQVIILHISLTCSNLKTSLKIQFFLLIYNLGGSYLSTKHER